MYQLKLGCVMQSKLYYANKAERSQTEENNIPVHLPAKLVP